MPPSDLKHSADGTGTVVGGVTTLEAVLWDMDGTLVDTEPYWMAAERRLVESFGGTWTDEDAVALVGNPLLVSAAYIRERGGVDLAPEAIVERLLVEVIDDCRRRTVWRPGAVELLAGLREAGIACALVTMSYRDLAQVVVDQLPIGTFTAVVTGDELSRGKPDPEAYLTAAGRLGAPPERCLAIEDSPTGLASACAAGCVTLGVVNQVPLARVPGRHTWSTLAGRSVADLVELVAQTSGTTERAGSVA